MQQLQDFLLHGVGLRQGADAGLTQNLELGQIRSRLAVVGRHDVVLRRNHVGLLGAFNTRRRIQRIDLRSQVTALGGHIGNRAELIAVSAVCALVELVRLVVLRFCPVPVVYEIPLAAAPPLAVKVGATPAAERVKVVNAPPVEETTRLEIRPPFARLRKHR